ncbi:hypothetical protein BD289DRAFT_438769 [Coniella lustricola]|uniref:Uncharacterized protein n=1 Tax=Coniella lustricola TaxID=2025994 RepID=A0A2T3A2F9_9PEZI|nr:hypothetical protein BD289DRAFT_438769 [Coniella lustricola]
MLGTQRRFAKHASANYRDSALAWAGSPRLPPFSSAVTHCRPSSWARKVRQYEMHGSLGSNKQKLMRQRCSASCLDGTNMHVLLLLFTWLSDANAAGSHSHIRLKSKNKSIVERDDKTIYRLIYWSVSGRHSPRSSLAQLSSMVHNLKLRGPPGASLS